MIKKGFKNLVNIEKSSRVYGLKEIASDTLRIGDLGVAVELPKGENLNEWLAVNTIEFFNEISLLFGCLTEYCTKKTCPTMSAGSKFEYLWADGNKMNKPLKVSAAQYIDYLMTWVENQIHNEKLFPTEIDQQFPNNFVKVVKVIFKRLFRIYAHIYHSHFNDIIFLEAEPHLNTSFKHFVYFVDEFQLVDNKELTPLRELIDEFKQRRSKNMPFNQQILRNSLILINQKKGNNITYMQQNFLLQKYTRNIILFFQFFPIMILYFIIKLLMLEYFLFYSVIIILLSIFVLHMTSNQWVQLRHKIFLTLIFYISFFPLSIIPLDLDLQIQKSKIPDFQEQFDLLKDLWIYYYWTNFVIGIIVLSVYTNFMLSGKLTLARRFFDSIMNKIIFLLVFASLVAGLVCFLIAKFWMKMNLSQMVDFTFSFYNTMQYNKTFFYILFCFELWFMQNTFKNIQKQKIRKSIQIKVNKVFQNKKKIL